jgi:chromosome segregation ATPase
MAIQKILIIAGAVLLVFSFVATVHSQIFKSSKIALINPDTNMAESATLQRNIGMNTKMSDQFSPAPGSELLSIAQSRDQIKAKIMKLSSDKEHIENQIEGVEKNLKELEGRLINDLENLQLDYDQRVRMSGTDDVSTRILNDIINRKERGELDIKQQKRRLANLYEELKSIQNNLEQLTKH